MAGCLQLEVARSTNCWQRGRLLKALCRGSKGDWFGETKAKPQTQRL